MKFNCIKIAMFFNLRLMTTLSLLLFHYNQFEINKTNPNLYRESAHLLNNYIPYPLLIANRSWILTIHKDRIFWKNLHEKTFLTFKKRVNNIQTAGYNGARTIFANESYLIKIHTYNPFWYIICLLPVYWTKCFLFAVFVIAK